MKQGDRVVCIAPERAVMRGKAPPNSPGVGRTATVDEVEGDGTMYVLMDSIGPDEATIRYALVSDWKVLP